MVRNSAETDNAVFTCAAIHTEDCYTHIFRAGAAPSFFFCPSFVVPSSFLQFLHNVAVVVMVFLFSFLSNIGCIVLA